jgi:hypothetical protein
MPTKDSSTKGNRPGIPTYRQIHSWNSDSFYVPAELGAQVAIGEKLAKVLGSPDLSYRDRNTLTTLLSMLADAVEIDICHPDIVATFWTLMVGAMQGGIEGSNRVASVRRRQIEQMLTKFEMLPARATRPRTLAEMGYSVTDKAKALTNEPCDAEVNVAKRRAHLRLVRGGQR